MASILSPHSQKTPTSFDVFERLGNKFFARLRNGRWGSYKAGYVDNEDLFIAFLPDLGASFLLISLPLVSAIGWIDESPYSRTYPIHLALLNETSRLVIAAIFRRPIHGLPIGSGEIYTINVLPGLGNFS